MSALSSLIYRTLILPVFSLRTYYNSLLRFIPCTVTEVVQFRHGQQPHVILSINRPDPRSNPFMAWMKTLFGNLWSNPYNWTSAFPQSMLIDPEGMFMIKTWNSYEAKMEHYFLNVQHLCNALSSRSVQTLWAFSDHGLVFLLSEYMEYMKDKMGGDIFDLQLPIREHDNTSWKDVTSELQPFIKCMQLRENATAEMIVALYRHLHPMVHLNEIKVRTVDFDLETRDIEGDTYIFP